MANSEQIEIISPHGQVRFYGLDPSLGVVNIGQHPDNDIVLDGRDVRPFHGLLDLRVRPYQYTTLADGGGFDEERPFSQWDRLRVGEHELVLVDGEQAGQQGLSQPVTPGGTNFPPAQPLTEASQAEPKWRARPGQTVRQNLSVQNSGDTPATFVISAGGVPEEWLWLSQETITLEPGGQAGVQLAVTPSAGPDTAPGVYPLTWRIESPEYPGWVQNEPLYLQIEVAPLVQMSRPEPAHIVSRAFRRSGSAHITVANWGNVPTQLYLSGQERRNDCIVRIDPVTDGPGLEEGVAWERPQANGEIYPNDLLLLLPPGTLAHLQLTLTPRSGRRFGLASVHHRFTASAQSPEGTFAVKNVNGTFESRPAIRMGFLLLLALLLALTALYYFRDDLSANFSRSRITPLAIQEPLNVPPLAWLAPSEANAPRPILATGGARARKPSEMTYTEMFQEVGALYGQDWRQLASHAQRESRLNPNAQGAAGEYGLMQILPSTWNEWAPLVQVSDPWDPYSNILVGAAYYSYIHSYFSDLGYTDPKWSLAAYNWGPERTLGLLDRGGDWFSVPLTQRMYVADILIGVENAPALVEEAEVRYPR